MLSSSPEMTKALVSADTFSEEDQNIDSSHAAEAKLPSADKIEGGSLAGADPGNPLMEGLERILTQWIGDKSKSPSVSKSQRASGFYSPRAPSISIKSYLNLCIHRCFLCSDECFVLAFIYIKRITKMHPDLTVGKLSAHRLLFFAVLLATKFHDDSRYSNKYYAKVGGLPIEEVNRLELKFAKMLEWKMFVEPKEYQFYHGLICQASNLEGPLPTIPFDEPEAEP